MWCCVCVCCAEASYTLLLYDELLEWSDRPLREFLNYPMQSEWQRKEYLHLTIVQNFDRGKVGSLSLYLYPFLSLFVILYLLFVLSVSRSLVHSLSLVLSSPLLSLYINNYPGTVS